jgi:hypothetical protein
MPLLKASIESQGVMEQLRKNQLDVKIIINSFRNVDPEVVYERRYAMSGLWVGAAIGMMFPRIRKRS